MTHHGLPADLAVSMLSTMYQYGILVATLCSLVWAKEIQPTPEDSATSPLLPFPTQGTDAPIHMTEFCFFGKFPSASCRFKCHLSNLESYCDETKNMCLCMQQEEEDSEETLDTPHFPSLFDNQDTSSQQHSDTAGQPPHLTIPMHPVATAPESEQTQDETGEKKHHVVFYIFDLNKIFGKKNQSETSTEVPPTAEAGTQTDSGETKTEGVSAAGWAFQHLMALLIIVLLSVLIVLELYACYKKQSGKNHMETIFKTMPIPNKA